MAQMGGVRGLIYSALPVAVLVPVNTAFGLVPPSAPRWRGRPDPGLAAVSARLDPARGVGFIGVGLSAPDRLGGRGVEGLLPARHLVVAGVGRGVRGVGADPPADRGLRLELGQRARPAWRNARGAVLAFDIATPDLGAGVGSRFLVQRHLYDADQTGWLGVARIAMGWPLTAVAALVTYLAIRSAQRAIQCEPPRDPRLHPAVDQTGDDAVLGPEENSRNGPEQPARSPPRRPAPRRRAVRRRPPAVGRFGDDDPLAAQDRHQARRRAAVPACARAAAHGVSSGRVIRPGWHGPAELHEPHHVTDRDRLHQGGQHPWVDTATSTPQALSNSHSLRGSLTRATTRTPRTRSWPAGTAPRWPCRRRSRRSPRRTVRGAPTPAG